MTANEFAILIIKLNNFISSDEGIFLLMILTSILLALFKENFVAMAMVLVMIAITIITIKLVTYSITH